MAVAQGRRTEGHGRQAKREKIIQTLRAGNTRKAAYDYAGVTAETFYTWLESDLSFSERVREAEAGAEITCATSIVKAAQKGDWRAGDRWLSKRRRDEWGDEINVRLLSDDQLRALAGAGQEGAGATGPALSAGTDSDGGGFERSLPLPE